MPITHTVSGVSRGLVVSTTARSMVPPSASAKRPFWADCALVKALGAWLKSSASIRVSGMAAQFRP